MFNKELYNKIALTKTAYHFTDKAYIHLDVNDKYYIVDIEMKNPDDEISEVEFKNILLSEMVRFYVSNQTKEVRELILARAFSSTFVENEKVVVDNKENFNIDDILTDWFECNE